jgi:hypothetical protein
MGDLLYCGLQAFEQKNAIPRNAPNNPNPPCLAVEEKDHTPKSKKKKIEIIKMKHLTHSN